MYMCVCVYVCLTCVCVSVCVHFVYRFFFFSDLVNVFFLRIVNKKSFLNWILTPLAWLGRLYEGETRAASHARRHAIELVTLICREQVSGVGLWALHMENRECAW